MVLYDFRSLQNEPTGKDSKNGPRAGTFIIAPAESFHIGKKSTGTDRLGSFASCVVPRSVRLPSNHARIHDSTPL